METTDFCLAYECPIDEVHPELLGVCSDLGQQCDLCDHRCAL